MSQSRASWAFCLSSPVTEKTEVIRNSVIDGITTIRAIIVTIATQKTTNFLSCLSDAWLSKNTSVSCCVRSWGSPTNMDMPRAIEKPPIAASGLSVRVRIPDSRRERMGTTVMFAAVGSSSDMACLVRGGVGGKGSG